MLLTIVALLLLLGIIAAIFFTTQNKSLRTSLLISVGFHALLFIKFFSAIPDFTTSVHNDVIDFTFIAGPVEIASKTRPDFSSSTSVTDGVKLFRNNTTVQQAELDEKKIKKPAPDSSLPKTADKHMPPLENIKWFDFGEHPRGASYRKKLQRLVEEYKVVPKEIMAKGWEANIKVWFNLSRNGTLNHVFIDKQFKSSYNLINQASIRSLHKAAQHFPPLPKGVKNTDVWFYVTLDYTRVKQ